LGSLTAPGRRFKPARCRHEGRRHGEWAQVFSVGRQDGVPVRSQEDDRRVDGILHPRPAEQLAGASPEVIVQHHHLDCGK